MKELFYMSPFISNISSNVKMKHIKYMLIYIY